MATGTRRQEEIREKQGDTSESLMQQPPSGREKGQTLTSLQARNGRELNAGQQGGLMNSINEERLARGLGWFSIGLGLAEVLAPRGVAKIAGVRGNTALIRLFGLREIASGIAIFMQQSKEQKPTAAVWSRVVGDALDLTALGVAMASPRSSKGKVAFATANVLAVTALDVLCAQKLSSNGSTTTGGIQVKKSIVINSSPEELYQFWHDFENLPRFMNHLESVRVTGERRSHWVAKAPAGKTVEWDAETTADEPNRLIAWRSLEGSDVDNSGSVRFERTPGGRGTLVTVELEYDPPGGVIGAGVAKLFGEEPEQQIYDDLRCFKQVIETGEVVVSEGAFWDNGVLTQRPAQPLADEEIKQQGAGR